MSWAEWLKMGRFKNGRNTLESLESYEHPVANLETPLKFGGSYKAYPTIAFDSAQGSWIIKQKDKGTGLNFAFVRK